MTEPIRESDSAVLVDVLVVPNASRTEVVGRHGDRIKVRVAHPPDKGRANASVVDLLCDATGARRGRVVAGRTARAKVVELKGTSFDAVVHGLLRP